MNNNFFFELQKRHVNNFLQKSFTKILFNDFLQRLVTVFFKVDGSNPDPNLDLSYSDPAK